MLLLQLVSIKLRDLKESHTPNDQKEIWERIPDIAKLQKAKLWHGNISLEGELLRMKLYSAFKAALLCH